MEVLEYFKNISYQHFELRLLYPGTAVPRDQATRKYNLQTQIISSLHNTVFRNWSAYNTFIRPPFNTLYSKVLTLFIKDIQDKCE